MFTYSCVINTSHAEMESHGPLPYTPRLYGAVLDLQVQIYMITIHVQEEIYIIIK